MMPTRGSVLGRELVGLNCWPNFCDSQSRAGRSLPPRREAQRFLLPASTLNPAGFDPLNSSANRRCFCASAGDELL